MAFPSDSGWGQFSNGNFSPVIYSKKAQVAFRKSSVIADVTNTDYFGEIQNQGDSVRIIKEPQITTSPYERGTQLSNQELDDADFTMVVDQANYFQFSLDDAEEAHSHINFMDLCTDNAGYQLRNDYDSEVLGYMSGWTGGAGSWARRTSVSGTKADSSAGNDELLAANQLDITDFGGSDLGVASEVTSIPLAAGGGSSGVTSPLQVLNRMNRILNVNNVPMEDRWVVVDPVFVEVLMDEDSKLVNADFGGEGEIRNGRLPMKIRGFTVYQSNNLPYLGSGTGTTDSSGTEDNFGVIVAGHKSAVATAEQINKTEMFRSPTTFADVVRGLHLYGRKILRPEGIVTANVNLA